MSQQLFQNDLSPRNQTLVKGTKSYFVWSVKTGKIEQGRWTYLVNYAAGKKVLHIGCVDHPIFKAEANLHIHLNGVCGASLDGLDTSVAGLDLLRPHVQGGLYSDLSQIRDQKYDLVLVPEVLEHVDNVKDLYEFLDQIQFNEIILTAPSINLAYDHYQHLVFKEDGQGYFTEFIHPDHRYWFTPYTMLKNIDLHTPWVIESMDFIELSIMARCRKG